MILNNYINNKSIDYFQQDSYNCGAYACMVNDMT